MSEEQPRIALVAEEITSRADEGSLRFLLQFLDHLRGRVATHAFHARGDGHPRVDSSRLPMPKLWVSRAMRSALGEFAPSAILYIPSASLTPNALWRARRLQACMDSVPTVVLGLQVRNYGWAGEWALRWLRPRGVILSSDRDAQRYRSRGWQVDSIPLGVDLDRFRPVGTRERNELRRKLGWPEDSRVVLHVGHLRSGRGLDRLAELRREEGWYPVVVASTSTPVERPVLERLQRARVELRREYDPRVERYYQAADAYVFPVRAAQAAIQFPLSVLEAMACDLPVVTTPHGSLREHFEPGDGLQYLGTDEDLSAVLARTLRESVQTRAKVAGFAWERPFDRILEILAKASEGSP